MLERYKISSFFIFLLSTVFLIFSLYFLSIGNFFLFLLPLFFLIFFLSIFNYKYLFFLIVFLTPFSVSLTDLGIPILNTEMAFPTEPILFGLLFLTTFKISNQFFLFKSIFKNPIVTCVFFYLLSILITSITSSIPSVSFKVLISRLWYIVPLLFLGIPLFKEEKNIKNFILLYTIPLCLVILYTTFRHINFSFDKESAHYMMSPFFNYHTSYGAMIAFFFPFLITIFLSKTTSFFLRVLLFSMLLIFLIGFVLSFSRAAWISLLFAFIFVCILKLKFDFKWLIIIFFTTLSLLFLFQNPIFERLENNRQDSSDNLLEHVQSLSNISTDASNMERINRWKCALRMFEEKPIFGWGPGTYQFQYGRFQLSTDRTIISTNHGDVGNAHSEYLSVLSESGIIGFISFLTLLSVVFIRTIKLYYKSQNSNHENYLLAIIGALTSYFIHGFFNNFLDTDKASVGIWCVIAMVIAIDLFSQKKQSESSSFS